MDKSNKILNLIKEMFPNASCELNYKNHFELLVAVVLSVIGMNIFVYFVAHFLVNAKKDELEKNNQQVMGVLNSVQLLSARLHTAGETLSQVSASESASTVIRSASFEIFFAIS